MPLHDWSRVPAGLFHHFHQDWSIEISRSLNRGLLPPGMSALVEQRSGPRETDVLAIESFIARKTKNGDWSPEKDSGGGSVAVATPPVTAVVQRTTADLYALRANRITIRHHLGRVVAVIEIVSPGNKDSRGSFRQFIEKSIGFLDQGIHLLVIDLFPPTPRDPQGIHKAIWDEITEASFELPAQRNRTLVSYDAGPQKVAYVEPIGVGDLLPSMPIFLEAARWHVPVPLESTYQTAWDACPQEFRQAVETGVVPDLTAE
jgi:hypothetical protein